MPDKSEIHNKSGQTTGYNRGENRGDTASTADPAMQEMTPTQGMQNTNGTDDTADKHDNRMNSSGLKQDTWNGRDSVSYFAPWWTVIRDAQTETTGDSRNLTGDYREQDFLRYGSGAQTFGLEALQSTAGNSMNLFGSQGYEGDVHRLSTGTNTFFDWIPKWMRDFVQSDVGRSVSVSGMERPLDKEEWQSGLAAIKQINVRQLTGAAAKIMGILSIVIGGAGIAALNITLGLCVVAQEVQEERRKEKERLEGLGWSEDAIKAELERKVPIWFQNKAMEFFVGEWLGKIAKFITNDKLGGIVIDQSRGPFLEWYKRMLIEWEEYEETMNAESRIDSWTKIIKEEYKE